MKKIVNGIFLIINLLVILCVLITYLGGVVGPDKWVIPAFFSLVFPLIILGNILFVLFWLLSKKWFFLFSLVTLVVAFPKISIVFPLHTEKVEAGGEKTFCLMSYNTCMSGGFQKHTKESPNPVIQHVLDSEADVVCLQEFGVLNRAKYLTDSDVRQALRKSYPYKHIYYKEDNKYRKAGIATFSKFPIINQQVIDFPSKSNSAIYSDILIFGDTVRLINCHLESNKLTEQDKAMPLELRNNFDAESLSQVTMHLSRKLGTAYRTRAEQARIVRQVVDESPYPVIVCGDFNDVPLSYAYTTVKGKDLKDSFAEHGLGFGNTFNERFYKFRIDYIFHDERTVALDIKRDKVNYSDHYPLVATIAMQ